MILNQLEQIWMISDAVEELQHAQMTGSFVLKIKLPLDVFGRPDGGQLRTAAIGSEICVDLDLEGLDRICFSRIRVEIFRKEKIWKLKNPLSRIQCVLQTDDV